MKPNAFIFDLDGTLINTHLIDFDIHREMLAHLGYILTPEVYASNFGNTREVFTQKMLHLAGSDLDPKKYLEEYSPRLEKGVREREDILVEAATDLCQELFLKGTPMAIVTSSPRSMVENVKALQKIKLFMQFIITSDDVQNHKPDPEPYLMAKEKMGENQNIFVFEDSMPGILAVNAARLPFAVHEHHANQMTRKTAKTLEEFQFIFKDYADPQIKELL